MKKSWREQMRQIINEALREGVALGLEGRALRRYATKAFPLTRRAFYPYRVWLEEIDAAIVRLQSPDRQLELPVWF